MFLFQFAEWEEIQNKNKWKPQFLLQVQSVLIAVVTDSPEAAGI